MWFRERLVSITFNTFKKSNIVSTVCLTNQVHNYVRNLCSYVILTSPNAYARKPNYGCENHQIRWYAARRGKQIKRKREQRGKEKVEVVKQPYIFPKLRLETKRVINEARRHDKYDMLLELPSDDVFRTMFFKKIQYTTKEAIEMHRELHHPTLFNNPEAILYATVELDMSTGKKNRFVDNFSNILLYPNHFDIGVSRKVLAICKEASDRDVALKAGAFLAGGADVIRQLQAGELTSNDFEYLVAHPDLLSALVPVRGLLKRKFPSISYGTLTTDIAEGVKRFHQGLQYTTTTDDNYLDFGWLNVPVGKLNMPTEEVEKNLEMLLNTVNDRKPKGKSGPFIKRVLLLCPPTSREKFLIPHSEYLPEDKVIESSTVEQDVEKDQ